MSKYSFAPWVLPILPSEGVYTIQSMFDSMLDANNVTKRLRINHSLGV